MSEGPRPVAFLGLGALGLPMAANLLRAGFPSRVHNRHRDQELPLAAEGAERGDSPAEAVKGAELICLCLSDERAVRQVLFGHQPGEGAAAPARHPAIPQQRRAAWRPEPW